MSANTLPRDTLVAPWEVLDPGASGTIDVKENGRAIVKIRTAGVETRTMANPSKLGQEVHLAFESDGGNCTIDVGTLSTGVVLKTEGDLAVLESVSVAGTLRWQVRSVSTVRDTLTAQLTTITHTAPAADDFAIQGITSSTPFGFANANEGNTVLKVIANLQTRMAELEVRLTNLGILAE